MYCNDEVGDHNLELHQDEFNGRRALLTIDGHKSVHFWHPEPSIFTNAEIQQYSGDAYEMIFRDDPSSIYHRVVRYAIWQIDLYVTEVDQ